MAEETITIIKQEEEEEFDLDHHGGVALYGDREHPALQHEHVGRVVHETGKPLVHMVCWEEECLARVEVNGRLVLAGDQKSPVAVNINHQFVNDHHQTLSIEPFDHAMKVVTRPAEPIHHALQMRSPLQLRFCNPWQVDSDYRVEVTMGDVRLFSIRLRGGTTVTPLPCEDEQPKQPPPRVTTPPPDIR